MNTIKFPIALLQMQLSPDIKANLKKTVAWVEKAAKQGAKIICLPELFMTPYFCQSEDISNFDFAETIPGPTTNKLAKAAQKNQITLVASLFEKRAAGLYHNTVVVIDNNGNIIGKYRKMHIPDDPAYYEKFYFTPGDLGYKTFATAYGKIGTLICWDQWFPEAARLIALQGANIIFYPTAIGWHPHEKSIHGKNQHDAWRTVQRGHAIANGIYTATVNRVGLEKPNATATGIQFWGSSFICNPQGVIIAEASHDKEEILYGEIDLDHLEYIRKNWPFFRDRRVDSYADITRKFIDQE